VLGGIELEPSAGHLAKKGLPGLAHRVCGAGGGRWFCPLAAKLLVVTLAPRKAAARRSCTSLRTRIPGRGAWKQAPTRRKEQLREAAPHAMARTSAMGPGTPSGESGASGLLSRAKKKIGGPPGYSPLEGSLDGRFEHPPTIPKCPLFLSQTWRNFPAALCHDGPWSGPAGGTGMRRVLPNPIVSQ